MINFLLSKLGSSKANFEKIEEDLGEYEDKEEYSDFLRREKKRKKAIKHGLPYTISLADAPMSEQVKYKDDWND